MSTIKLVLFLIATINSITSYKILVYVPQFAHSHVSFMGSIADALTLAGHDVLVLIPRVDPEMQWSVGAKLAKTRIFGNFSPTDVIEAVHLEAYFAWSSNAESISTSFSMMTALTNVAVGACEVQLENTQIIDELKREKYDLGICEYFAPCGFGIFELANIPAHIVTSAPGFMEGLTDLMGVPNVPSYVPNLFSSTTDRMSYMERVANVFSFIVSRYFLTTFVPDKITRLYREKYGENFVDIYEKISRSSFMFVNVEEYFEYARPTSHRIVHIGGIGIAKPKPLDETFENIVQKAKDGVILISFGSVAQSHQMPIDVKRAFLKAFSTFPSIDFIWKYEQIDDEIVRGYDNVHVSQWIPQIDLLNHSKVLAFITHSGANSIYESIRYATPMICIPLFGDQMRNARLVAYRNVGIILNKLNITVDSVSDAIHEIITNKTYINNVRQLSKMISTKAGGTPTERVVKYAEFAAEFGELNNLVPYGRQLGYIEYFLIDIIIPAILLLLITAYSFVRLVIVFVRYVISRKLRKGNSKKNE